MFEITQADLKNLNDLAEISAEVAVDCFSKTTTKLTKTTKV